VSRREGPRPQDFAAGGTMAVEARAVVGGVAFLHGRRRLVDGVGTTHEEERHRGQKPSHEVPGALHQQPGDVVFEDSQHQQHQHRQSEDVGNFPRAHRNGTAAHPFPEGGEQPEAVQDWDGQEV